MYVHVFLICTIAIAIAMRAYSRRRATRRYLFSCLLPLCFAPLFFLLLWSPLNTPPKDFSPFPPQSQHSSSSSFPSSSSSLSDPLLCLHPSHFGIFGRYMNCFPRVRGLCISPSQVCLYSFLGLSTLTG